MLHALVLALAPQVPADPATLLPPAPDGWRYERLDLPLSFAPDLGLAGFEELRFAPGMFDPRSGSYWSYVLALELESDHDVDLAFVEDFLVGYDLVLCQAVGADRGLEIGPEDVIVTVARDGEGFAATIELVDAFVTGDPLTLRLALEAHAAPGATELFGIASPAAADAAVWGELGAQRDAWRAARPPAVTLNHVYVVVDAGTYAALRGSEDLRALGVVEERTTTRADTSYTGLYLYGQRTYVEFLERSEATEAAGRGLGVALGVERRGGTEAVRAALREAGVVAFGAPITRRHGDEELPWFEATGIQAAHVDSRTSVFLMEYLPAFLAGLHPDRAPAAPLLDVSELFVSLDEPERAMLFAAAEVFGWTRDEGDAVVLHAPQLRVAVRPSEGPGRLTGLRMTLREPLEWEDLVLGDVRVAFQGRAATLFVSD